VARRPTIVHPDADVDVSTIEPETGLTQRAARECAAERNRRRDPDATVSGSPNQPAASLIVVTYWIRCARKRTVRVTPLYNQPAAASSASPRAIAILDRARLGFDNHVQRAGVVEDRHTDTHGAEQVRGFARASSRHASVVTTYCRSVNVAVRFTDTRAP